MKKERTGQNEGRSNPEMVAYYHHLSDLIQISWQLNRVMEQDKTMLYPGEKFFDSPQLFEPPDFDTQLALHKKQSKLFNVREYMSKLLFVPLLHTQAFFTGQTFRPIPKRYLPYINHPFVTELIQTTNHLAKKLTPSRISQNEIEQPCHRVIVGGQRTASEILPHLGLIMEEEMRAVMPLMLSKVSFSSISELQEGIGLVSLLTDTADIDPFLLDFESETGLNHDRLRELGYGSAIGCPASIPPSRECKSFLHEELLQLGVENSQDSLKGTMLAQATLPAIQLALQTRAWYNQLSDTNKQHIIGRDRDILEGDIRRNVRGS